MERILDRMLRLWGEPPAPGEQALAEFRAVYADPVLLNGSQVFVEELVLRARILHTAFVELKLEVVTSLEASGRLAVVFQQSGRHVGALPTPLGDLEPTGRVAEFLNINMLTIDGGLITEVWVVADELGRLMQLEAVARVSRPAEPGEAAAETEDVAE